MKYIKLFQTIADKQAATLDYPNTNYVVENSKASIEKKEPIDQEHIVGKFNVTDTTAPTKILNNTANITYIIVDGVQQNVTTGFTFSTTGEHKVKYKISPNWNGNDAFTQCHNLISVTMPDTVTSIGGFAFSNCTGLTNVTIGNGVTSIGNRAFQGCRSLTSITIPDSVTSIGDRAFNSCSSLSSITIPDSVTSIGDYAFQSCSGLISVTAKATTPPSLGASALSSTNNCPIYVPADSVDAYKAASGWSDYASRIQAIQ